MNKYYILLSITATISGMPIIASESIIENPLASHKKINAPETFIYTCLKNYIDSVCGTLEVIDVTEEDTIVRVAIPNDTARIKSRLMEQQRHDKDKKPLSLENILNSVGAKNNTKETKKEKREDALKTLAELSKLQDELTSYLNQIEKGNASPETRDAIMKKVVAYMEENPELQAVFQSIVNAGKIK